MEKPKKEHWSVALKRQNQELIDENMRLKASLGYVSDPSQTAEQSEKPKSARVKQLPSLFGGTSSGRHGQDDGEGDVPDDHDSDPEPSEPPSGMDDCFEFLTITVVVFEPESDAMKFPMEVSKNQTMTNVKAQIEGKSNIKVFRQKLFNLPNTHSIEYDDTLLVSDYIIDGVFGMGGTNTIFVEILGDEHAPDFFEIEIVKTFDDRCHYRLNVYQPMKVSDLKFVLYGRTAIRPDDMRLMMTNGDMMTDTDTISQSLKVLNLTLNIKAGAPKKRKPTITDLKMKNDDPTLVKNVFVLSKFNEMPWLSSLNPEQMKSYLASLESSRHFNSQVMATVELIQEYRHLKDWKFKTAVVWNT